MEIIRDLVDLVSRNKLKSVELLGQAEKGRISMVNSLYFKIASGEFMSDEEAAHYYFGASPADNGYRKLKNRSKTAWSMRCFLSIPNKQGTQTGIEPTSPVAKNGLR